MWDESYAPHKVLINDTIARAGANIINLRLASRDGDFHAMLVDVEVKDLTHVMRILSNLRASDVVVSAERG